MTVQNFIVIYNETFRYIDEKYGPEKLNELWAVISRQWCTHLRDLVEREGLQGMYEYWGGSDGTLNREKAGYSINLEKDEFRIDMKQCPSVAEIKNRGFNVFHRYCEHCPSLYNPVIMSNGFCIEWEIGMENDVPSGICRFVVRKEDKESQES